MVDQNLTLARYYGIVVMLVVHQHHQQPDDDFDFDTICMGLTQIDDARNLFLLFPQYRIQYRSLQKLQLS